MDDEELFADLSSRLRDAHRRVAALDVDGERKALLLKRLLVISDASKHGLERASQRLNAFLAELDEGAGTGPDAS